MKLLPVYHKKRNTIVCISAVKTLNAVEIQDFFITLILLSKDHAYFYYIIRQSYPSGSQPRSHLQCSGVPRANSFFKISLKMLQYFQNVIKPTANCYAFATGCRKLYLSPVGCRYSLKRLGSAGLAHDPSCCDGYACDTK